MSDKDKLVLIEYVLTSIDNGALDEDVRNELRACENLAKTLKNNLTKHFVLNSISYMIEERTEVKL